jgi:hypothetical protein
MTVTGKNKTLPQLSHSAFWDIDLTNLDFDRYGDFTIIRVFERGTPKDIQQIINYYGNARIINSLLNASSLQPRAIALGQIFFDISPNQFACSRPSQQVMSYSQY